VSFEVARLAFDDPFAVTREDRRHDYGEDRYILLDMVQGRLHATRRARADYFGPIGRTTATTALP
jgi:uncharacterized DUF497 family protein